MHEGGEVLSRAAYLALFDAINSYNDFITLQSQFEDKKIPLREIDMILRCISAEKKQE